MAEPRPTLKDLLRTRFELCGRISAAQARMVTCQQLTFGNQIAALAERRFPSQTGEDATAREREEAMQAMIAALEAEIGELERELADVDQQIAAERTA
ncbi:hypothetical protein QO001_005603 [Methylobacterium brachiatum]|uniref:Uncharacterized protein n=1 Tax=Methylobacterium brachiatum TaxID=269660 RepID=A0AAJ1TXA8_9HYPH|nr:hypothetical protein [Methylobacterium brachiatum]MCB4806195.1 hypothetical protein [Methylobacterium brachiatum]MDQ0546651.1 hypothetical protein [Methylobacterium brachiatum]